MTSNSDQSITCRAGCGACCIVPSISSPIPGMPDGKPAGQRCIQLDEHNRCKVFGLASRPQVCLDFNARADTCGTSNSFAFDHLIALEQATAPSN
ncbi:YkgJ family cysteine cluster protein [Neiella marina]|uniref:YkgJ family cysteine cluster protein n=1 Tax=Neiella holothuriorum TaxID=2870530 RepID=A0ABS7EIV1_9GAMM|nr:YkgJ family cysteine cluster protein [Neiella holothuriorum]MBW8192282.1 YkgJ family cysteine cluster protein [Neiella holothuriorum]